MFETAGQAHIFLATVYGGLIVGFLYDVFTLIRRAFRLSLSMTGALDFLFWLIAAGVLVIVLAISGGDGLRAYMLMGFASGTLLYAAGVHFILKNVFDMFRRAGNVIFCRTKKAG
ncbi:MAG: spore cortex biosynthesis protein YabQ [Oscillospiraceae bacterium]|jgi:spore cortex biosynthesis protein YabQ|nr:spore cortex biosynthesis protein YabQ [Oscillospiraceae bacterium]